MRTRSQKGTTIFQVNGQKQTKGSSLILSRQFKTLTMATNSNYVISSAKTHHVRTTTEFDFITQPTHTIIFDYRQPLIVCSFYRRLPEMLKV